MRCLLTGGVGNRRPTGLDLSTDHRTTPRSVARHEKFVGCRRNRGAMAFCFRIQYAAGLLDFAWRRSSSRAGFAQENFRGKRCMFPIFACAGFPFAACLQILVAVEVGPPGCYANRTAYMQNTNSLSIKKVWWARKPILVGKSIETNAPEPRETGHSGVLGQTALRRER